MKCSRLGNFNVDCRKQDGSSGSGMAESKVENKMKGKKSDDSKEGSGTDEYDSLLKSLFAKEEEKNKARCRRLRFANLCITF